jgi:hypothetical protein
MFGWKHLIHMRFDASCISSLSDKYKISLFLSLCAYRVQFSIANQQVI